MLVYDAALGAWIERNFNTLVIITPSIDTFTADISAGASSAQNAEVASGGVHSPAFAMTYTGVPSAATIDVSAGGDPGSDWPVTVTTPFTSYSGTDYNKGTSVSTIRTFTISATVNGQAKQKTCTVTYINRRYCGPHSDGGQLTSAEILTLDDAASGTSGLSNSKYGTFYNIDTGAGEYIYYCYRSALGTVSHFSIENEAAKFNSEGGVLIEDKVLTLALHYRMLGGEKVEHVKRGFLQIARHENKGELEIVDGAEVLEVRPKGWHKGKAVQLALKDLGNVLPFYIGDDATDEDAFRTINNGITVRVSNSTS